MNSTDGPRVTIGSLVANVVVPLAIVVAAISLGAMGANTVLGHGSGFLGIILTLFFGAIAYVLALPLYWAVFVREW